MFNTYEQGMNNMHDTIKENQTLNWIQTIQRGQVDCFNQLLEVYDQDIICLLYTSDAADELDGVGVGGGGGL